MGGGGGEAQSTQSRCHYVRISAKASISNGIVQLCKDLRTGTIYHLPNILEFSSLESTMTTRNSIQYYLSMIHAP